MTASRQPVSGASAKDGTGGPLSCKPILWLVVLGIVLFGEPATAARLLCISLIVAGILGLKLLAP